MAGFRKQLLVASTVKRIARQLNGVVERTKDAVAETLFTQAALLASEIRSVAPVDPTSETPGALRNSVRVEEGRPTSKKAVVVKVKAGGALTSGSGYDYARAVEFGTQNAPAHPFFHPIYRARRKGIKSVVRKSIKNSVKGTFK